MGKVLIASLSIIVGMWLERFIIVVPTLSFPTAAVSRRRLLAHLG